MFLRWDDFLFVDLIALHDFCYAQRDHSEDDVLCVDVIALHDFCYAQVAKEIIVRVVLSLQSIVRCEQEKVTAQRTKKNT